MTFGFIQRFFIVFTLFLGSMGISVSQNIADSLLEKLNQSEESGKAEILNTIAESLVREFPEAALPYAEQALALAQQYHNQDQEAAAWINFGDVRFFGNDYPHAIEYYTQALQIGKKSESLEIVALSNYYLAYTFDMMTDFDKAKTHYLSAIQVYDSLAESVWVAEMNSNLARLYQQYGENFEAKSFFEKALFIYESVSMRNAIGETHNSMGVLYYEWGNHEKAIHHYKKALQIYRADDNMAGIAQILNNLGLLYIDWENYDEARKYFDESLPIEKSLNNKSGIATAYNNIGIIYAGLENTNKAVEYYEMSLALYEEDGDKSGIATALNNLGDLYLNAGETELAIVMLKKSLALQKSLADKNGLAIAYNTLSQLFLKTGELETSRKYNDSSFAIASQTGAGELLIAIYETYSRIFEAKSKKTLALEYLKKYMAIKDSLYKQTLHQQLAEVKARYELEQKEQEIELLNSKDRLTQLDLENKQNIVQRQRFVMMITIAGLITLLILLFIVKKQVKQKKAAYTILDKQNTEIKKSREELLVAKEKAEESDKLKSVFLANISHELRTPLNGILGFTDVLRTELDDPEYKDMANIIHNSGNRLLDTLNSIIDLSIIESQKMEIEYTEISLFKWMAEQTALFMAAASSKNLDLIAEIEDESTLVSSDLRLLTNLLNNLIDNAIKYTYEGGINIKASVINNKEDARLKLEVIDTGIGIEEDKVQRIFDKFRQASEGQSRKFEGAGLGLTLCQKYVEILGGEISLESRVDYGSHFTVLIPVKIVKRLGKVQT